MKTDLFFFPHINAETDALKDFLMLFSGVMTILSFFSIAYVSIRVVCH